MLKRLQRLFEMQPNRKPCVSICHEKSKEHEKERPHNTMDVAAIYGLMG